jgi:2-haloacid dehalogenase
MKRRTLLSLAASSPFLRADRAAGALSAKAIAFDAFAVFDPRPIAARVEHYFPGRGAEFTGAWRTRQFEYTWLRTLTNSYIDFWTVTEAALVFTTKLLDLKLTHQGRQDLMAAFLELRPWPDAPAALEALRRRGIRLVLLSNFTPRMLHNAVSNAGLERLFEPHLSTDRVRAYKPDPRAYGMALKALGLRREAILFAAFAGWDAAGAKAFGFPTFWLNRMASPLEELGSAPDGVGADLNDLAGFVLRGQPDGAFTGDR